MKSETKPEAAASAATKSDIETDIKPEPEVSGSEAMPPKSNPSEQENGKGKKKKNGKGKEKATTESAMEDETKPEPAVSAATESTLEDVERFSTASEPVPTLDFFREGDNIRKRFQSFPKLEGRGVDTPGPRRKLCTPKFQKTLLNGLAEILSYYQLPSEKFSFKDRNNLLAISIVTIRETKRIKNCDALWVLPSHQKIFCDAAVPIYKQLCIMSLAWTRNTDFYPPKELFQRKDWKQYLASEEPRSQSSSYAQTLPAAAIAIRNQWLAAFEGVAAQSTRIKPGDSESTREWKNKLRESYEDALPDYDEGYLKTSLQGTEVREVESFDDTKSSGSSGYRSLYHLNQLANKYNPGLENVDFGPEDGEDKRTIDLVTWPKAPVPGDDDLGGFKGGDPK
ncbi:hypothetical protein BU16DRAFT_567888 [Lophium mytilinum]|uniref:Uncharacterized protein n=1 Tax=Lophium mytilinum TaxID=390894 RepID=A0A6A6QA73_9PEZI|nr:hypothetical protein BU16DRAFT_567888 [Lophium mytilinum]